MERFCFISAGRLLARALTRVTDPGFRRPSTHGTWQASETAKWHGYSLWYLRHQEAKPNNFMLKEDFIVTPFARMATRFARRRHPARTIRPTKAQLLVEALEGRDLPSVSLGT